MTADLSLLETLDDAPDATAPIPVAAMDPDALGAWARLRGPTQGGVRLPLAMGAARAAADGPVAHFLAHRTAEASRLALACAAVPSPVLTPELVRLVRTALFPEAGILHEAEFFLGGLLDTAPESDLDAGSGVFRWRAGVGAELRAKITASQVRSVVGAISGWLEAHWTQAAAFRAALYHPERAGAFADAEGAFAEVARELLAVVGISVVKPWTRSERMAELLRVLGEPENDVPFNEDDAFRARLGELARRHPERLREVVDAAIDLGVLAGREVAVTTPPGTEPVAEWFEALLRVSLAEAGLTAAFRGEQLDGPVILALTPGSEHDDAVSFGIRLARERPVVPVRSGGWTPTWDLLDALPANDLSSMLAGALLTTTARRVPIVGVGCTPSAEPFVGAIEEFCVGAGAFVSRSGRADTRVHLLGPEPQRYWIELGLEIEVGRPLRQAALRWPAHSARIAEVLGLRGEVVPGSVLHTAPGGIELAYIPSGTFDMGSARGVGEGDEQPRHSVTLTRPFLAGVSPITQAQWRAIAQRAGLPAAPSRFPGDLHPVEQISWFDAVRWCNALSAAEDRPLSYMISNGKLPEVTVELGVSGYRLPTEAEWERLCRSGSPHRWSFGDDEAGLEDHGWFARNAGACTHLVGQKLPNLWGLYDLYGNVWEWTTAHRQRYPQHPSIDPFTPAALRRRRALRGGSWRNPANWCRSAARATRRPEDCAWDIGFRIILPLAHDPNDPTK